MSYTVDGVRQMSELTTEERERIARNREEALRRAAARRERERIASSTTNSNSAAIPRSLSDGQPSTSNQTFQSTLAISKSLPPSLTKKITMQPVHCTQQNPLQSSFHPPMPNKAVITQKMEGFTSTIKARLPKSEVKVTMEVLDGSRFKTVMHPFHSAVVDVFKTVPSRVYDSNSRQWNFAYADVKTLQAALEACEIVKVHIEPIPADVLSMITMFHLESVPEDLSVMIDKEFISKLFPYQKEGVRYALQRRGRVLFADEMGLGKSVQALAVARYYKSEWPLLIVCPSSVKDAWRTQLATFLPYLRNVFIVDKGSDEIPDVRTSNTVVIMSYDLMVNRVKKIYNEFRVVIFDESHSLKDGKAQRTKAATEISKNANRIILLSGTPALSRPAELFSQIKLIDPRLFPNFVDFAMRYCDGKQGRFCFEAKGATNSRELSAILSKRLIIRRLKADVLKELPDKRREVVYLTGDKIDLRMESLQKAKQCFERENRLGRGGVTSDCLLEYYNLTGIVKAAAVFDHIRENYLQDENMRKLLIFAHHGIVLDTIQCELQKIKVRSIRIDGHTPAKDRGERCRLFQEDEDVRVALLSITAAGVGITLTAASVVVFAELHWNPGALLQAEDRAHRVGQQDSVFVQYLIARNTADDHIWPLVQSKLDVLGKVMSSSEDFRNAQSSHVLYNENTEGTNEKEKTLDDYFVSKRQRLG